MDSDRRDEIKMWAEVYEDLPDGAFFAVLENEHGISTEEVADAYTKEHREGNDG